MKKISNYFTLKEALSSEKATLNNINNVPTQIDKNNIIYSASRLDTIRTLINKPMLINSWFRCPQLNKVVNGVPTSNHLTGLAIDFTVSDVNLGDIFDMIINSKLSFDELLYYPKKNFIHISFKLDINTERKIIAMK